MNAWWYAENGQQFGPMEESRLVQLFRSGKIGPQTLVWHAGMAQWLSIASATELRGLMAPPVPPTPPAPPMPPVPQTPAAPVLRPQQTQTPVQAHPATPSAAGSYAANYAQAYQGPQAAVDDTNQPAVEGRPTKALERYFARSLDLCIEYIILLIPGILLAAMGFGNIFTYGLLVVFLIFALAFILDAVIFAIFGNTPGKALLGVCVVRNDGSKLGFGDYLIRNIRVWMRGFFIGIPGLSLIAMLVQANHIQKRKAVPYDVNNQIMVLTQKVAGWRMAVFCIMYIGISLLFIVSQFFSR